MAELLYKLKEWLTVSDAAAHLSIAFGEDVTEAEVLRLGLDKHLILSVNFVNPTSCCFGKVVPWDQANQRWVRVANFKYIEPSPLSKEPVWESDPPAVPSERQIKNIRGLWDLPMMGYELLDVERRWIALTGGPQLDSEEHLHGFGAYGAFVTRKDVFCKLYEPIEGCNPSWEDYCWKRAGGLPPDAVIVVRTTALDDLKEQVRESSSVDNASRTATDKLLTKERTSLQIIIAALARLAKIDIGTPSKAATSIQAEADRLGATIGLRTVENHLKRVPDALERRR